VALILGGLDSSLITSIACRHRNEAKNSQFSNGPVHSFSIGIRGAPDLVAAKKAGPNTSAPCLCLSLDVRTHLMPVYTFTLALYRALNLVTANTTRAS